MLWKKHPNLSRLLDITLPVLTAQNLMIGAQVSLKGENWASLEKCLLRSIKDQKNIFILAVIFRIQLDGEGIQVRKNCISVLWQSSTCIKMASNQHERSGNASYIVFRALSSFWKKNCSQLRYFFSPSSFLQFFPWNPSSFIFIITSFLWLKFF